MENYIKFIYKDTKLYVIPPRAVKALTLYLYISHKLSLPLNTFELTTNNKNLGVLDNLRCNNKITINIKRKKKPFNLFSIPIVNSIKTSEDQDKKINQISQNDENLLWAAKFALYMSNNIIEEAIKIMNFNCLQEVFNPVDEIKKMLEGEYKVTISDGNKNKLYETILPNEEAEDSYSENDSDIDYDEESKQKDKNDFSIETHDKDNNIRKNWPFQDEDNENSDSLLNRYLSSEEFNEFKEEENEQILLDEQTATISGVTAQNSNIRQNATISGVSPPNTNQRQNATINAVSFPNTNQRQNATINAVSFPNTNQRQTATISGVTPPNTNQRQTATISGVTPPNTNQRQNATISGVTPPNTNQRQNATINAVSFPNSNQRQTATISGVTAQNSNIRQNATISGVSPPNTNQRQNATISGVSPPNTNQRQTATISGVTPSNTNQRQNATINSDIQRQIPQHQSSLPNETASYSSQISNHLTDNPPLTDLQNTHLVPNFAYDYQNNFSTHKQSIIVNKACIELIPNYQSFDDKNKEIHRKRIKNILRTYHTFSISQSARIKYSLTIYTNGHPLRFQRYNAHNNYLEIIYYCGYKPRCNFCMHVKVFDEKLNISPEEKPDSKLHNCRPAKQSQIIKGTNPMNYDIESQVQDYVVKNPTATISETRKYANQLIYDCNQAQSTNFIQISEKKVQQLYYEVHPVKSKSEIDLINEMLEFFNQRSYFITQSTKNDNAYYFFGLERFIRVARYSSHCFIDGTFKVVPVSIMNGQLLNLLIFDQATQLYLPFLHIIMTGRTETDYQRVFSIMEYDTDIKIPLSTFDVITTDFEKALQGSIYKRKGEQTILTGCIYHFIAALVKNFKKKCDPEDLNNKILLKLLCSSPFMPEEVFDLVCNKIKCIQDTNEFAKYFIKTWSTSYNSISKLKVFDNIYSNNGVESYNKVLNTNIVYSHPTILKTVHTLMKVDLAILHRYARADKNTSDHKQSYFIKLKKINEEIQLFEEHFGLEISLIPEDIMKKYKDLSKHSGIDFRDIEIERYMSSDQILDDIQINLEETKNEKIENIEIAEDDLFQ